MTSSKVTPGRAPSPPLLPEGVAAQLLLRFLRDPFSPSAEPRLDELSNEERNALELLASSRGISVATMLESETERARVRNALVHGLSVGPLSPGRAGAARERLGDSGLLSPSEYQLEFPDVIKSAEELGDRRSYIETAIRQADSFQHLSPTGKSGAGTQEGISLFVRKVTRSNGTGFAHLVVMSRAKSKLRFQAAWRVTDDIAWHGEMSPLELLQAFVDRFGMPFKIPGRLPTKFLLYDAVPWSGVGSPQALMQGLFDPSSTKHNFNAQFSFKLNDILGVIEFSVGYVIDTTTYMAHLRSRGVG